MEAGKEIGKTATEKAHMFWNVFNPLDLAIGKEEIVKRKESETKLLEMINNMQNHEENVLNEDFRLSELNSALL